MCLSAKIMNKFNYNNNRFHKEFICKNWEIGGFRYAGVEDRASKLYPDQLLLSLQKKKKKKKINELVKE